MKKTHLKNAVILVLVSGTALLIVFTILKRGTAGIDTAELTSNPELKPTLLANGEPPPFDAAFLLMRPADVARTPLAVRFDSPLGSEHAALTYDAQPFLAWNRRRESKHLGSDLNGIGGMDTDLGAPVRSMGAGRVTFAGDAGPGWGNMVIVAHAVGASRRMVQSIYAHLKDIDIAEGMRVARGEPIGTVGKAGGLYPAHLHLEMRPSLSTNPGEGYSGSGLNRIDPEAFLQEHRGAAEELLNPAPEWVSGETELRNQ